MLPYSSLCLKPNDYSLDDLVQNPFTLHPSPFADLAWASCAFAAILITLCLYPPSEYLADGRALCSYPYCVRHREC